MGSLKALTHQASGRLQDNSVVCPAETGVTRHLLSRSDWLFIFDQFTEVYYETVRARVM